MSGTVLTNQALNSGCWVREALPDAVADAPTAVLQLQHADGDAMHRQHEVRPPLLVALEHHLLDDGAVVLRRPLPVEPVDALRHLARLDLHGTARAQQGVDGLVVAGARATVVVRLGVEPVERDADLCRRIAAPGQPCREQTLLAVAVAPAVRPIAAVAVTQRVAEAGDDTLLGGAFGWAHAATITTMPCI
jgi:hypothetical protein